MTERAAPFAGWNMLSHARLAGSISLFALLAPAALPQAPPIWTLVSPTTDPNQPTGERGSMTFDVARGELVALTGSGQTWTWDGSWTLRSPTTSPPARDAAAMTYDAARNRVVLFGGYGFGDTWEWDGSDWTDVTPVAGNPSPRYFCSFSYAGGGRSILFGGTDGVSVAFQETWEWDGTTWTQRTPLTSPPARVLAMSGYEAHTDLVILFGGTPNPCPCFGDTWVWDGTDWNQIASTGPSARNGGGMAYDPLRRRMVMFGGWSHVNGYASDTWTFDSTAVVPWSSIAAANPPGGREALTLGFDPVRDRVVFFGGYNSPQETWVFADVPVTTGVHGVGAGPQDIDAGDVDGDSDQDLITANHDAGSAPTPDSLSVLLNDGSGGFPQTVTVVLPAADDGPISVALCDLDDDGRSDDAAVACDLSSTIVLVTDVAGGSPSAVSLPSAGLRCSHVAAGDLDGDPRDDVVVARQGDLLVGGGGVEVLLNGAAPVSLPAGPATRVVRVGIADLDGDGDRDIVAVAHGAADAVLLYAGDGAGGFTLAGSLLPGAATGSYGLSLDDLDRDGDVDITISVTSLFPTVSQQLRVWLYTGSGALDASDYTAVPGIPTPGMLGVDIASGDFEDDGIPGFLVESMDVTVVNAGSGDVHGHHGFDGSSFGSASPIDAGTNPLAVVMADLDGDGCDDVAIVNQGSNDVSVQLTEPPPLAQSYGAGCAGSNGNPVVGALNSTTLGSTDFAVLLSNARSRSPTLLMLGFTPADIDLGPGSGCSLLTGFPLLTALSFTSGAGTATFPILVPSDPEALGLDAYFQWAVFDPSGSFAGLSLSDALRIQIGQ